MPAHRNLRAAIVTRPVVWNIEPIARRAGVRLAHDGAQIVFGVVGEFDPARHIRPFNGVLTELLIRTTVDNVKQIIFHCAHANFGVVGLFPEH
jgi:hypothetical protein